MGNFEAFIYGLVQGVTEYLPVSSSAHLLLVPHVLKTEDPGLAFDVILHLGTLFATIAYFFKEWLGILKNPSPKVDARTGKIAHLSWLHLIVGTLPAVLVGLVLNHWIQDHTRSLVVLWFTLPVFGVILWWADKVRPSARSMGDATVKDLFWVGCMQCLSLVPGVSRSGSTITAGRLLGFSRVDSAKISFLLSMPVTLGAIVYEGRHWREVAASISGMTPLVIALFTALISGAVAIHYLIRWLSKASFAIFAIYRVAIGIVIAIFLGTGE